MTLGRLSLRIMAITFIGLGLMSLISPTNLTPLVELWNADDVHHLSLAVMHGEYATITDTRAVLGAFESTRTDA